MKLSFVAFFSILTMHLFAQKNLFDTLQIDRSTKIVGRYPQYDKSKTYEKYNFIIEDSVKIVEFIKKLSLGKEVVNYVVDPSFELTVVKNNKEIGSWTINPTLGSAMTHDGQSYEFDLNQIKKLNALYPFKYYCDIKVYKSRGEYETYLAEQKKNPKFLFDYSPQFKYEGSFDIEFPNNTTFSSPKAISDLLKPCIEKIVNKGEYSLSYILDTKNMNNRNQYTMTIQGPKKLFEQLKYENFKNEHWLPTVEEAYFFYKK